MLRERDKNSSIGLKTSYFPLIPLPSFIGQFAIENVVTEQSAIGQLNKPITFKVVVTCVRARFCVFGT